MNGDGAVHVLDAVSWAALGNEDRDLAFIGLFVSAGRAYAVFDRAGETQLVATELVDRSYPSIAARFPAASWFERLAHDLSGAAASGATDTRPAIAQGAPGTDAAWPRFIETAGEGLFQIGAGPVSGVIAAPMHRRFTMDGARVVRLEHRVGYAHRGIAGLMRGKSPRAAARYVARIAGDATVAHSVAFAHAAETVAGQSAPARAVALREAMLALERVTTDLSALVAAANAAGDLRSAGSLGQAREEIAVASGEVFGHRLMMDIVVPGGLALDVREAGLGRLRSGLDRAARAVRAIGSPRLRRDLGEAAPVAEARARSVLGLAGAVIRRIEAAPAGMIALALPAANGMAIAAAASARGMVHHWLTLADGEIIDWFAIDPSARLLPVLETAVIGLDFDQAAVLAACYGLSAAAIDG